jgi:hypothetical protein
MAECKITEGKLGAMQLMIILQYDAKSHLKLVLRVLAC